MGDPARAVGEISGTMGDPSHAMGEISGTMGDPSRATGEISGTMGDPLHAMGQISGTMGDSSHATGEISSTMGDSLHAMGQISGTMSDPLHAMGQISGTMGDPSHAMGEISGTTGDPSRAMGEISGTMGDPPPGQSTGSTRTPAIPSCAGRRILPTSHQGLQRYQRSGSPVPAHLAFACREGHGKASGERLRVVRLTLPDHQNPPPEPPERRSDPASTERIPPELCYPEDDVALRPRPVATPGSANPWESHTIPRPGAGGDPLVTVTSTRLAPVSVGRRWGWWCLAGQCEMAVIWTSPTFPLFWTAAQVVPSSVIVDGGTKV